MEQYVKDGTALTLGSEKLNFILNQTSAETIKAFISEAIRLDRQEKTGNTIICQKCLYGGISCGGKHVDIKTNECKYYSPITVPPPPLKRDYSSILPDGESHIEKCVKDIVEALANAHFEEMEIRGQVVPLMSGKGFILRIKKED